MQVDETARNHARGTSDDDRLRCLQRPDDNVCVSRGTIRDLFLSRVHPRFLEIDRESRGKFRLTSKAFFDAFCAIFAVIDYSESRG